MAFIVSDYWQGLGLGTKLVDYTLDIAKEKGIQDVYAIMLQDNYRALSLTKKMGFQIEYLNDGTVKGSLNLKEEDIDFRCTQKTLPEPPKEVKVEQPERIESKVQAELVIAEKKKMRTQEASSA
jgi:RimJ/RimL family protein N-acetyltransferase